MFLTDIFEAVDRGKLDQAIESFESHLHSLDVEGDKAADILQAVFSQVSNEYELDADTQIALADWLKEEHNLSNLQEGEIPVTETTSAGSVAGVNSALGAGDPKASIYYNQKKKKKKKKYESKYARMNQLAEQIATMEAQLIKNNAPSTQKLTETEAEAVYIVKEMIENLDYNPDDAMKEAEGLLIHEGHDTKGLDWCSVADHILILN